jgi:hypothetical protein
MRFQVSYKVLTRSLAETSTHYTDGPSNYVVDIEAANQTVAENQVRNMNGGANFCIIQYARPVIG